MIKYVKTYTYYSETSKPHLKSLLKVFLFLKEYSVVDDNLWRCNPQIDNAIVDGFARFERSKRFLQISVHGPQAQRLIYSGCYGFGL